MGRKLRRGEAGEAGRAPAVGALLAVALLVPVLAWGGSCVECHRVLRGKLGAPVEEIVDDVHLKNGLGCADCHGGDPGEPSLESMAKERGFVGAPSKKEVPVFCGRCHGDAAYMRRFNPALPTDQLSRYRASPHGARLRRGDERVAECVSCHGVHDIRPPDDARSPVNPSHVPETCGKCHGDPVLMKDSGRGLRELEAYRRSVHGRALLARGERAAPACNDCHSSHGRYPRNVNSISEVCGECHPRNRDLFAASPHYDAFRRLALPGCATCHGHHEVVHPTDSMIGDSPQAICTRCHAADTAPAGLAAARAMRADIESLKAEIARARELLAKAASAGMEVSDAAFELKDAEGTLVRARSEVHTFSPEKVHTAVEKGLAVARRCRAAGQGALMQMRSRRRAVAIPLGVIALAIVLLVAKIRTLES